jgi:predicted nuclease of restriction endonuclease-like RecB superfamily
MQKKALLRYKIQSNKIIPFYLQLNKWRDLSQSILDTYNISIGKKYNALEETLNQYLNNTESIAKVSKGFINLIEKKIEFEPIDTDDFEKKRKRIFLKSAKTIRSLDNIDYEAFLKISQENNNSQPLLYGDLKENQILHSVPSWSSEDLINRYNISLTQGILNFADEVILTIKPESAQKIRSLLRYFSFLGLLYEVLNNQTSEVRLKISGPLSEFSSAQKYKSKIATIIGILPQLGAFTLSAKITINNKKANLYIDDKKKLKSHFKPFFDYVPEEIESFINKVDLNLKKYSCIRIYPEFPIIEVKKWYIPDYCWNYHDIQIELMIFQKFQKNMLLRSFEKVKNLTHKTLVFFIDRSIKITLPETKNIHILYFKDIPSSQKFIQYFKKEILNKPTP